MAERCVEVCGQERWDEGMNTAVGQLGEWIQEAQNIVFFGGAGVSTPSGIPDFRSAHGIYAGAEGRSYEEMLSHDFFMLWPDKFWAFYKDVMLYPDARPNPAHEALARLEAAGKLRAVITQNIDGLHQLAGSQKVLELHGTVHRNLCMQCGKRHTLADVLAQEGTPRCSCGGLIKPDVVLYGEGLDDAVVTEALDAISQCDLLIVGGTSLVVYPAAGFIRYRKSSAKLALINRDATAFDRTAQLVIRDDIAQVLDEASKQL